jgi:galactokinase
MVEWAPLARWRNGAARFCSLAEVLVEEKVAPDRPVAGLFVPGRVELFGKHTDYAGGRSLLAALPRGLTLLVARRQDPRVHWRDRGRGVEANFALAEAELRPGHWSNYVRAVVRRAATDFGACRYGMDVVMASDLPSAAGLSSSSALIVATFLALDAVNELSLRPAYERTVGRAEELAGYLGSVESGAPFADSGRREGVGTFGGSEDHTAMVCSLRERLRQYRFGPIVLEAEAEFPRRWRLFVATSGVRAKKTGGAGKRFNHLVAMAHEALVAWRRSSGGDEPHLGDALAAAGSTEALVDGIRRGLSGDSLLQAIARVRQFAVESEELVPAATAALAGADGKRLGVLAHRSQTLAEASLGNQVPETSTLTVLARECGALAASGFGAGFGGAVWAIVEASDSDHFLGRWRKAYTAAFAEAARGSEFFDARPSAGARWLTPETGRGRE